MLNNEIVPMTRKHVKQNLLSFWIAWVAALTKMPQRYQYRGTEVEIVQSILHIYGSAKTRKYFDCLDNFLLM
jgi:hypothetical protein